MKVLGLVVEYNPFHNGHLYHLAKSKEKAGADHVVCVMSGNYVQRGEAAIANKWARARIALLCGADLVIELPVVYAMSSAEYFAYGAVSILDSLNIVDCISFGSESGRIDELSYIADILITEPESYKNSLKESLNKGLSYPASREKAIKHFGKSRHEDYSSYLSSSNNILGIEYLKALKKLNSKIQPITIERIVNSYNSNELTGSISSASAIRRHMQDTSRTTLSGLSEALPEPCISVLEEEFASGRGPVFSDAYESIILSCLRKMTLSEIRELPYVSEGMENRIKKAAEDSGTLSGLIERTSTKRYPQTRIQRALFSILTGLKANELETFTNAGGAQYIKVLGFNSKGRNLLAMANKKAILPIIVKTADFKNSCNPLVKRMLEIESSATDIYVLGYQNPEFRKAGQEFTQNIVRV
ncbi:MAG TPA: nucleotidyltransferase [Clostridia bacterium]|nr:nucleotidyltransferase [Clostridia bacterium]